MLGWDYMAPLDQWMSYYIYSLLLLLLFILCFFIHCRHQWNYHCQGLWTITTMNKGSWTTTTMNGVFQIVVKGVCYHIQCIQVHEEFCYKILRYISQFVSHLCLLQQSQQHFGRSRSRVDCRDLLLTLQLQHLYHYTITN